jgi:hypothetical protein
MFASIKYDYTPAYSIIVSSAISNQAGLLGSEPSLGSILIRQFKVCRLLPNI